jgi:hypothetical protein
MRWSEYRAEVDELHASDELKAKLLAMQTAQATPAAAPAQSKTPQPTNKKPPLRLNLNWKRIASMAACFMVGVIACSVLSGQTGIGLYSGASYANYASDTAMAAAEDAAAAENGWSTSQSAFTSESTGASASDSTSNSISVQSEEVQRASTTERKIIYTAYLYLQSKQYDETRASLDAAVSELGGYTQACDEYSYANSSRSVTLTLRIPAENYQAFLTAASGAGNLRNKSEQAEDITAEYIDLQARISSLETQRARLLELEEQAETLSDLLEIQSSLTDVQYQLESWQSQMAWYNDQVDYCTVTVELSEVKEYTTVRESFGEQLIGALSDGGSAFIEGVQNCIVWIAYHWAALLLILVLGIGVLVWRVKRKNKK